MPKDKPALTAVGQPAPRREDPALLRGEGLYTGDVRPDGALHIAFLRSPVADAALLMLDCSAARAVPGVVAVLTAQDFGDCGALSVNPVLPMDQVPDWPVLARDRLAAVGQPVAAVVATSLACALDGVEAIALDHGSGGGASAAGPLAVGAWRDGAPEAAAAAAAHVVTATVRHARLAPCPMEPRAVTAVPGPDGLTVWLSTQTPHRARADLAQILGLDMARLRVIAPDVGGAFGMKASLYPEEVCTVRAALLTGRPVRWQATRSDDFVAATHGRGGLTEGRLAVDAEGRFLALIARARVPLGHWLPNSALVPAWNAMRILPGPYAVGAFDLATEAVPTPTPPVGIYRGAGRPEAAVLMERLVDEAARATGLDPAEIRRRNLLPPHRLPLRRLTGARPDSGDYAGLLATLLAAADYDALRRKQAAARATGALPGLGLAVFTEPCGSGWETATAVLHPGGRATIATGGSTQGHGRATAFAAIAADALGIAPEAVTVLAGDTGACPEGIGALASRSTPIGGSAVLAACRAARARADAGEALPLTETCRYAAPHEAWAAGACLAEVLVDPETGVLTVERLTAIDDAGRIVNPTLVAGQIMGGLAQGFGEAVMEALHFDPAHQLLTGSLMDYALPRAADMPAVALLHGPQSATDANLLGAKGVGEGGTIGAPAAILNAACDALAPLGVTGLQMPLTPHAIWQAIATAKEPR